MNETLELLIEEYKQFLKTPEVRKLWELINSNKATFKDAVDYSKLTADKMAKLLVKYIGFDAQTTKLTAEEMAKIVERSLIETYDVSAAYAAQVQKALNDAAGINIKAIKPEVNTSRIANLVEKLKEGEDVAVDDLITASNQWLIEKNVIENFARSAINDCIDENAKLHSDAGLKTILIRHLDPSGCCKWCQSMAGTYTQGNEPKDFWRVHKDCGCWIEYKPAKKATSYVRYTSVNGKRVKITN